MADLSNYAENKIVDSLFRGIAYAPANYYLAAFTVMPNDAGGGTEVNGGSYARVQVPCNTTTWSGTQGSGTTAASSGTGGTISNNIVITFPSATANWGSLVGVALYDAASGGNFIAKMIFPSSVTINSGDDPLSFGIGGLTFQIDN